MSIEQYVPQVRRLAQHEAHRHAAWDVSEWEGAALELLTRLHGKYSSEPSHLIRRVRLDLLDWWRTTSRARSTYRPRFVNAHFDRPAFDRDRVVEWEAVEAQVDALLATARLRRADQARHVLLALAADRSQRDIAAELGVHEARVSQIVKAVRSTR